MDPHTLRKPPRIGPGSLVVVVAALALVFLFFAKAAVFLVTVVAAQPGIASALRRAGQALGLGP